MPFCAVTLDDERLDLDLGMVTSSLRGESGRTILTGCAGCVGRTAPRANEAPSYRAHWIQSLGMKALLSK